jgi:hypothetical protein
MGVQNILVFHNLDPFKILDVEKRINLHSDAEKLGSQNTY